MRYSVCLCAVWLLGFCAAVCPAYAGDGDHLLPVAGTQWKGRKVAFMGDSITDKAHVGTTKNYWQYLQEMLGGGTCRGSARNLGPSAAATSMRS